MNELDKNLAVLIAEDDDISRHVLRSILVSFGFENILEATNGAEAVELGRANAPRFALLDIYMPQMDGWEVARKFKAELPNTILIMITSSRDMADIDESVAQSIDGYFFKPFQKNLLLEKMTQLDQSHPVT